MTKKTNSNTIFVNTSIMYVTNNLNTITYIILFTINRALYIINNIFFQLYVQ